MRREGYIIEEIIEYSNMSEAFDSVLRGTGRKRSRQGRFLLAHREKIIAELTASIASGKRKIKKQYELLTMRGKLKNTVKNVFCRSCP